jgi:hypothetical protein
MTPEGIKELRAGLVFALIAVLAYMARYYWIGGEWSH